MAHCLPPSLFTESPSWPDLPAAYSSDGLVTASADGGHCPWQLRLMGCSTAAIGLLPTYASIGVAAPLLLLLCRLVQGFSAGGEYTGAATFVVEHAPSHRRGLYAGIISSSSFVGSILATVTVLSFSSVGAEHFGRRRMALAVHHRRRCRHGGPVHEACRRGDSGVQGNARKTIPFQPAHSQICSAITGGLCSRPSCTSPRSVSLLICCSATCRHFWFSQPMFRARLHC